VSTYGGAEGKEARGKGGGHEAPEQVEVVLSISRHLRVEG